MGVGPQVALVVVPDVGRVKDGTVVVETRDGLVVVMPGRETLVVVVEVDAEMDVVRVEDVIVDVELVPLTPAKTMGGA